MHRLYLRIYLAFVAILILFIVFLGVVFFYNSPSAEDRRLLEGAGEVVSELLPGADRPVHELQAKLDEFHEKLDVHLAVHDKDGRLIAASGDRLPAPDTSREHGEWIPSRGRGFALSVRLPDGRRIVGRHARERHVAGGLLFLVLAGLAAGIGAYPVARSIAGRLERLQARVDELGSGDLSVRVAVEGKDEVAKLAGSFNRAAERIERLVEAQGRILAHASHELRSPLTRIRMAVELLQEDARPELFEKIHRDIEELDVLIEEILLASRVDSLQRLERTEKVELAPLVEGEAESAGVAMDITGAASVEGDPRLLRRLVRNLLENARRHGGASELEAHIKSTATEIVLRIADRGPGVVDEVRERIFEPFYRPPGTRESVEGGAGLGLALVRQIARGHGGDAVCVPRDGGGTCFEVTLRRWYPPSPN